MIGATGIVGLINNNNNNNNIGALALDGAVFGRAIGPIWLSNVQCIGNESRLADCRSTAGAMDYRCDHSEDAGVRCYNQEGM